MTELCSTLTDIVITIDTVVVVVVVFELPIENERQTSENNHAVSGNFFRFVLTIVDALLSQVAHLTCECAVKKINEKSQRGFNILMGPIFPVSLLRCPGNEGGMQCDLQVT